MLKKVFAVFPVFIFFAYSGLFVFASPSSPVVFSSRGSASTNLPAEKIDKIDQLWSEIKDEIKKPENYFLIEIPIEISTQDGKLYDLGPLYKAAQNENELAVSGSSLTTEGAREKLLELVNAGVDSAKVNSALFYEEVAGFSSALASLWASLSIQELLKKYAHLIRVPIMVEGSSYDFEPFYNVAARNQEDKRSWHELPTSTKDLLIRLADQVGNMHLNPVLAKTALDLLWSEIKSELKTKYAYLSKTLILVNGNNYNLEPLFTAAKNDAQYEKEGSELPAQAKNKLQELVNAVVIPQKLKDALDVKNNEKLDAFWSEIKSELKKPEYAHLSKTPILVNGNNYNLEPLFVAVKNEYGVLGSQLSDSAKNKLQSLVSADVQHPIFKSSLTTANIQNNQKLDNFWEELKKTNYANLARLPVKININNKSYDLAKIFSTITQFNGKGSKLPLEPRTELQNLINAGINPQQLGDVLKQMLVSLDNFWTQLKKILNQPEFDKWKNTSIKIKNKNYDLQLLFAAAKNKVDVKDSVFPLNAKVKLQELLNNQVTSKMVENQLLALNQAEAEKNQQAKEKQQHQGLTIGLATGGGVLVAAGLGGFLYWFFKIRK